MGIKQLYNDNLRKLPNEYGDVSVMFRPVFNAKQVIHLAYFCFCAQIYNFDKMILVGRISSIVTLWKLKHQNMNKVFHIIYWNLANLTGEIYAFVYAKPPYLVMKSYDPISKRQS